MMVRRMFDWPAGGSWSSPFAGWQSPFAELERMRREMDRLFEGLTGPLLREPMAGVFPLMNLTQDRDNYYVRAELPGMRADEINISTTANGLSILGERRIATEGEKASYHRRERGAGSFRRALSLPSDIDAEKVEARYVDGVLTVILPKAEAAKPKQIAIKTS